ncbi:DNA mismatch endonuclease Vsr [Rhizobium leguminosarum bv. viciae]|nr:DNA mismatch endonuclease Vsr [Rhizobium leguminosarum bv. viciae]
MANIVETIEKPEVRSQIMRAIRKTDTKPEIAVRRLLHASGFRFRLYRKDLPGTPDIVLPRHRSVVFVHGCFWHQHTGCRYAKLPRTRTGYWLPKLARNVERDAQAGDALTRLGWRVHVVWECELDDKQALNHRLGNFLIGCEEVR